MAPKVKRGWDVLVEASISNPVAFFFAFRWLTWFLALGVLYSGSAPGVNRINEPGLAMYTALQLGLATLYAAALHPRLARSSEGLKLLTSPYDLVATGLADLLASLVVVYFSGGWGSPFWHYAVTSLLVPCFLVRPRWGVVVASVFVAAYVVVVAVSGSLGTALLAGQRNVFIGNLVTAYLVAIAVGYLGSLFRALQAQRVRTRRALDETELLFQLAQNVVEAGVDTGHLLSRMTQVLRASGLFAKSAIYLRDDQGALWLGASSVGIEELPTAMVERSSREGRTVADMGGPTGQRDVAVPLVAGEERLGVMLVGTKANSRFSTEVTRLVEAMASLVAIGIRNTSLARQRAELAAQEERGRVAREIHDGIAQSIYMLGLRLETCADLASQKRQDLKERLDSLVAMSKQTLLEVRHYIFDLKPYLAGEKGVAAMVEDQVREFSKVSGTPAALKTRGTERQVPVAVATCLYRVTQEALANVFKHARASNVDVLLEFTSDAVQLEVRDNGQGFDCSSATTGHGLSNMRQRAEELGGSFSLTTAPGAGTRLLLRLPC